MVSCDFDDHVAWLRAKVPAALAILLEGSHARGEAQPGSDVDLRAITPGGTSRDACVRFVPDRDRILLPVVAHVTPLPEWLRERSAAADWAWGLPAATDAVILWSDPGAPAEAVAPPPYHHPPCRSSLQDLVEYACKAARAHRSGDRVAMALFTRDLAREAAALLRQLNPGVVVSHPADALRAVLEFSVAPPGYRRNMEVLVGVRAPASQAELANAAGSLALGVVDLLSQHLPHIETGRPDLREHLEDGTLRRYLLLQSR